MNFRPSMIQIESTDAACGDPLTLARARQRNSRNDLKNYLRGSIIERDMNITVSLLPNIRHWSGNTNVSPFRRGQLRQRNRMITVGIDLQHQEQSTKNHSRILR